MCGYKVPGMNLSRVLTSCVRRDRVICKTLTVFNISHSKNSTKLCFCFISSLPIVLLFVCVPLGARGGAVG